MDEIIAGMNAAMSAARNRDEAQRFDEYLAVRQAIAALDDRQSGRGVTPLLWLLRSVMPDWEAAPDKAAVIAGAQEELARMRQSRAERLITSITYMVLELRELGEAGTPILPIGVHNGKSTLQIGWFADGSGMVAHLLWQIAQDRSNG